MALLPPKIFGLKAILKNLKKEEILLGARFAMGLKAAGLLLQSASQKLAPVDTGNLKASAFTRAKGVGIATTVQIGYTAGYALFVHELVQMKLKGKPRGKKKRKVRGKVIVSKGLYWDPQGRAQAKFLEEPSRTKLAEMLLVVKKFAQITVTAKRF
jgi:hypothetical protein